MKFSFVLFIVLNIWINVFSQNKIQIDSLTTELNNTKSDTTRVIVLNKISKAYLYGEFNLAKDYAEKALKLAQKISFQKGIALSYAHLSFAYQRMGNYDEAIIAISKSTSIYELNKEEFQLAKNYSTFAQIYYSKNDYKNAVEYTNKSIALYEKLHKTEGLEINYMTLGAIQMEQGIFDSSLTNFLKSIDYCQKNKNLLSLASNYNNIAILYRKQNDLEKAEKYYLKSLDINQKIDNKQGILKNINNIAVILELTGRKNQALINYRSALKLSEEMNFLVGIAMACTNIAGIQTEQKNFQEAHQYLNRAEKIYFELGDEKNQIVVTLLLGQLFYKQQNMDKAISLSLEAYTKAEKSKFILQTQDASQQLAAFYEKINDFKNALKYFKIRSDIKDSILKTNESEIIENLKIRFETKSKDEEIKLKNAEIIAMENSRKIKAYKYYIFIVITFILLISGFFSIFILRNKINKSKEQAHQKAEIAEFKNKLLENEIKYKDFNQIMLQKELSLRQKELQMMAFSIIDKNEFLDTIKGKLKKITEKSNSEDLKLLIQEIVGKMSYEKDSEEFLSRVKQINESFFKHLVEKYPELSEYDQRLASLLRMGLLSKEIAAILNITVKSVDTGRYRLRKKLNLEQEINLNNFFKNI